MPTAQVPAELLDPVVAYFRPRKIILFGSAARGQAGPDSDYDLLVILDDDAPPEKRTLKAGFEAARPYRRAADITPVHPSVFAARATIPGTLSEAAAREGIVVTEPEAARGGRQHQPRPSQAPFFGRLGKAGAVRADDRLERPDDYGEHAG